MNINSTQTGHTPSEEIFDDNTNETDINQILSMELVTTSQLVILVNTTNMIPSQRPFIGNVPTLQNQQTTRQQRRRQRRRERQRERRRQRREVERQQRQEERQRSQQERERYQRFRWMVEPEWDRDYLAYIGFPEYMDELDHDILLEEYEWDKMGPKQRWEQEQLNEFEGFVVLEQISLMQEEIEQPPAINVIDN
ncbi:hypothetical protein NGRA_2405 [Nosema granulosis]|uniref:Uncharacterized protein n=1 Tax=Nosema granulosis TaxID=83296 RepID=A0A9P6GXJ3_9MICR|nr:hypothetical protein NGRA_2405 [Nosema granulosis]